MHLLLDNAEVMSKKRKTQLSKIWIILYISHFEYQIDIEVK